jgi:hypothetical protein
VKVGFFNGKSDHQIGQQEGNSECPVGDWTLRNFWKNCWEREARFFAYTENEKPGLFANQRTIV